MFRRNGRRRKYARMTSTVLDRWGNSLAVRLSKSVVETAGLQEGDRVSIQVEKGYVIIHPVRPRYTLDELLEGVTPETLHEETDFGGDVGAENVW